MNTVTFYIARLERIAKNRRPTYMAELRACGTPTPDGKALTFDTDSDCWLVLQAAKGDAPHAAGRNAPEPVQPLPRSEWPLSVRVVARLAKDGERGIGTTLTRLIAGVGGEVYKQMAASVGIDCRCAAKAAALDRKYPY